jgi:hypothetical protein
MSRRTEGLLKREKMEVTLSILIEYYSTSKQVKGRSKKTHIGIRNNLGKFVRFLEKHGHPLKHADLTVHNTTRVRAGT